MSVAHWEKIIVMSKTGRDHKGRIAPAQSKIAKVMREYKHGALHSGNKKGPEVKSRKQAEAIALSEARRGKK